jgi:hypothetical protein
VGVVVEPPGNEAALPVQQGGEQRLKAEGGISRAEVRNQKPEVRGPKAKGGRLKAEMASVS